MIRLTRLNGQMLVVNADMIEFVEEIPDTIVSLTTGKKIMVRENCDEIIAKVVQLRRVIAHQPGAALTRSELME